MTLNSNSKIKTGAKANHAASEESLIKKTSKGQIL